MIIRRFAAFASVVSAIALIAGLCGCDIVNEIVTGIDDGDGEVTDDGIGIEIGVVLPLTGEYAAPYGLPMMNGLNLARDEINGKPYNLLTINFLVEDDMSTRDGMVSAFERHIEAGVPAIVGIVISNHAQYAFPIAQENQVVAFSSGSAAAGLSSIGDYIFRATLAVDKSNRAGVNITHESIGYESAAMMYDDADLYSTSSNEQLTAALLDRGVEVLLTETFQTGDIDFTAQLTAIMESNTDAIFISGLSPEMVRIVVQAREIGIEATYIAPAFGVHDIEQAGAAANGVITFANWDIGADHPMNPAFVASYRSAYASDPTSQAAQSYAALHILYHAIMVAVVLADETPPDSIVDAGLGDGDPADFDESPAVTIPDATAIRDALAEVRDLPTNLGIFSFDPDGEALYNPVVLIVKDGSLVPFGEPDTEANATIVE